MSVYASIYGPLVGQGDVEDHVIDTLRTWIVPYLAEWERQHGFRPRTIPPPPTPDSIHGGVDFETFSVEIAPEIIVVVRPTGEAERHESGTYGQWFAVGIASIVHVEGDQDGTRDLAAAYGSALAGIVAQQGGLGFQPDGETLFATRTRLASAADPQFPDATVRDVIRIVVTARTFVADIVSDMDGPRTPPLDPYATPGLWPTANRVEVDLIRGAPDVHGPVTADEALVDGTVVPEVTRYQETTVIEP